MKIQFQTVFLKVLYELSFLDRTNVLSIMFMVQFSQRGFTFTVELLCNHLYYVS